jgi:hypothetical protein
MEPIQTHEQLLVHLAGNGDPCAFYTLIVPFANAAYVAERNSGKRHSETLSALLPSFKKMYQNYISRPVQGAFKEWYKEQEIKYLSASQEIAIESLNDAGVKNLLSDDIAHFDWALNLILQRRYGKFRRAKKRGAIAGPNALFKREHWFFKTVLFTGLISFFLIIFYLYLMFSKTQFTVSLRTAQTTYTAVLPFTVHTLFQGKSVFFPNGIVEETAPRVNPSSQSLFLHDTLRIHDTVRIFNRSKSPVADGSKPAVSPTIGKTISPPAAPPVKKPSSDSLK